MKSKASISPRSLVILTGAGISAESGIDTFRASDGLWENHKISEVATPEGFAANPIRVHEFYNARRAALKTVTPNAAHDALARLLAYSHKDNSELDVLLVTQNVDDLHERAGASAVIHMHGELSRAKCTACDWSWSFEGDMSLNESCPACHSVKTVRPDIVWFHLAFRYTAQPYHMRGRHSKRSPMLDLLWVCIHGPCQRTHTTSLHSQLLKYFWVHFFLLLDQLKPYLQQSVA